MSEPTPSPTPSRAVYGYAWHLFFKTGFILYVLWAFLPEYILEDVLGLTYLPNKYFALCIPITVVSAVMYSFIIYPLINLAMQDDCNDPHTILDERTIKRCSFINKTNGKRCEQIVKRQLETAQPIYNPWVFEKFCEKHNDPDKLIDENVSSARVKAFCDCVNKKNCRLEKSPNHLRTLDNRETVPSMIDLDIGSVSRQLYLDD